jgi:hypothetical protein
MSMSVTNDSQSAPSESNRTIEHTLLADERQTPCEDVHKVREPVRVRRAVELPDVHHVALVLQDGCLVVVDIQVVWSTEDSHDGWEASRLCLPIHPISTNKGLIYLFM